MVVEYLTKVMYSYLIYILNYVTKGKIIFPALKILISFTGNSNLYDSMTVS